MRPDIDRQRTDEPSSLGEADGEVTIIFNVLPAQWETVQQLAEAQGVTIDQLLNQAISHLAEICAVIERGDLVTLEAPMPFGRLRRLLGLPDVRQRDIIFSLLVLVTTSSNAGCKPPSLPVVPKMPELNARASL